MLDKWVLTILGVNETKTTTYGPGLIDRLLYLTVYLIKFHLFNAGHIPEFQINSLHSLGS
jgi:hypothetical protein